MSKTCIIGLGSPHGDDAVGWRVVEELDKWLPLSVRVMTSTEPTELMPLLGAYDRCWIVDACRSEQQMGTITRFTWPDEQIDRRWSVSGHGIGLAEVLELARTLGSIPRETVVYTIDIGQEPRWPEGHLTAAVAAAAALLRGRLIAEVVAHQRHGTSGTRSQTATSLRQGL